jgi:hypothetical protein
LRSVLDVVQAFPLCCFTLKEDYENCIKNWIIENINNASKTPFQLHVNQINMKADKKKQNHTTQMANSFNTQFIVYIITFYPP